MNHVVTGAAAWALGLAAVLSAAQSAPEFEIVSVRRSPAASAAPTAGPLPGTRAGRFAVLKGGRFEARGHTLTDLARVAFGFEQADPTRGIVRTSVDWAWTDRFDITATADHQWTTPPPGTMVPEELRTMLRALLEERFAVRARIETKAMDVTALRVVDREVLGPGLRPSTAACLGPYTEALPGETPPRPRCPFTLTRERLQAEAVTMAEAARLIIQIPALQGAFRRESSLPLPLIDQTSLPGAYDLELALPYEVSGGSTLFGLNPGETRILKAIETQLGLKLARARAPIPTLIIERARKPRED